MINFPLGNPALLKSPVTTRRANDAISQNFADTSGLTSAFRLANPGNVLSLSGSIFPTTTSNPFSLNLDSTVIPTTTTNLLQTSTNLPDALTGFTAPSPGLTTLAQTNPSTPATLSNSTQPSFIVPVYLPQTPATNTPVSNPVNGPATASGGQNQAGKTSEIVLLLLATLLKSLTAKTKANSKSPSTQEEDRDESSSSGGKAVNPGDNEYFNFKQGQTGDCAVLSGIVAVANDADGKKLLDSSIKANPDGSYKVTLKGTGETFDISKADMDNDKLSKGEPKVRALENAIKQHYAKKGDNFEGKGGPDIIKLLTGKQTKSLNSDKDPKKLKERLIELAKTDTDGFSLEVGATTLTGSETKGMHGYAVTEINEAKNTVTYENPWDAKKLITVSLDDFTRDLTAEGSGGVDYAEI